MKNFEIPFKLVIVCIVYLFYVITVEWILGIGGKDIWDDLIKWGKK